MKRKIFLYTSICCLFATIFCMLQLQQKEANKSSLYKDLQQVKHPANHLFNISWWKYSADLHIVPFSHKHKFSKRTIDTAGRHLTDGLIDYKNDNFGMYLFAGGISWLTDDEYDTGDMVITQLMKLGTNWANKKQERLDPLKARVLLGMNTTLLRLPDHEWYIPYDSEPIFRRYDITPSGYSEKLQQQRKDIWSSFAIPWDYQFYDIRGAPNNFMVSDAVSDLEDEMVYVNQDIFYYTIWLLLCIIGLLISSSLYFVLGGRAGNHFSGSVILIGGSLCMLGFAMFTALFHVGADIKTIEFDFLFPWEVNNISINFIEKSIWGVLEGLGKDPTPLNIAIMVAVLLFIVIFTLIENGTLLRLTWNPNIMNDFVSTFAKLGVYAIIDVMVIVILVVFAGDAQTTIFSLESLSHIDENFSKIDIDSIPYWEVRTGLILIIIHYFFSLIKKLLIGIYVLWMWIKLYIDIRQPLPVILEKVTQQVQKRRQKVGYIS